MGELDASQIISRAFSKSLNFLLNNTRLTWYDSGFLAVFALLIIWMTTGESSISSSYFSFPSLNFSISSRAFSKN